jgi:hypothetical protein
MRVLDIHLDGYVPIDGTWLAAKIAMMQGGFRGRRRNTATGK